MPVRFFSLLGVGTGVFCFLVIGGLFAFFRSWELGLVFFVSLVVYIVRKKAEVRS